MALKTPGSNHRLRVNKRKPRKKTGAILILLLTLSAFLLYRWLPDIELRTEKSPKQPAETASSTASSTTSHRIVGRPRIVVIAPLTGPFKKQGKMLRQGIELAWEEERGPEEPTAELTILDGGRDPVEAVRMARDQAKDPDVLAAILHLPQAALLNIIPLYRQEQLLMLVPANSHQNLVGHPWVLPLLCSDRSEGAHAARIAKRWAAGRPVAVLSSSSDYGKVLTRGFTEAAEAEGLEYAIHPVGSDSTSAGEIVAGALESDPAVIWLAGSPLWGADIVKILAASDYEGRLLAPRSYDKELLDDLFPSSLKRLYVLRPVPAAAEGNGIDEFHKSFLGCYWRKPEAEALLGYDSMRMVCDVLRKGPTSRSALRQRLLEYDAPARAFHGVGGDLFFREGGGVERPVYVAKYQKGHFVAEKE